jgi:DNA repair protein RecN (Recombination protein N)
MKTNRGGLTEFSVQNIGGIQKARLGLSGRFIAVTGESGAGKSSLVRALEYLAGKRAQTSSIRHGFEEGEVWGIFRTGADSGTEKLAGRVISRNGRNRNYLEDQQVPFARLRDFTEDLIGIQSQFSQLDLLDPKRQRNLLDSCGGETSILLRGRLSRDFEKAIRLEKDLASIVEKRKEIENSFQEAELVVGTYRGLRLDEGNELQWEAELSSLEDFLGIQRRLQETAARFLGGASGGGLGEEIQQWAQEMIRLISPEQREKFGSNLENFLKNLQEMERLSRLSLANKAVPEAEERRTALENRLGAVRKLKRMVKAESLEQLSRFCEKAEENILWLRASAKELEDLRKSCQEARSSVFESALALREQRSSEARLLERKVTEHLADLAMESFAFSIAMRDLGKIRPSGADEIEFWLSNGDLSGPIMRIASGGELSRILLALQMALPDGQLPETLVFDEVEAGLGGRSALLAGFKLRELSSRCQVILVTHEAVIAAQADQHFVVRRSGDLTTVTEVTGSERSAEIARMLSGNPDSPEALEHAAVLLKNQGQKLDVCP